VLAVALATAVPPSPPTVSSGRGGQPYGFALEGLSICSAENLTAARERERSPSLATQRALREVTGKSSRTRSNGSLLSAGYTNLRPKCRRPRFRISLEIVTTECTNPTGRLIREDTRLALCRCGASANKPFCDGSHRRIGFTTAPAAAEEAGKAGMPLQSESRALQAAESADRRSGGISWKEPIEGSRDE